MLWTHWHELGVGSRLGGFDDGLDEVRVLEAHLLQLLFELVLGGGESAQGALAIVRLKHAAPCHF